MLTDADCRNATCPPGLKRRRLTDTAGLYLEVSPAGSKRWFWKFYPDGKESRLALGSYPEVSLKAARLAREFHEGKASGWSETHAAKWMRAMEKDVFPRIGSLPLASITAPILLDVLTRVEARGAGETARKLSEAMGQVFRRGAVTGRCERNPAEGLVGELMRGIDGYIGQPVTRAALALSALLFQRPGNVRMMEWSEIDLDAALWSIPAVKMKRTVHGKVNGRPHLVPLAAQARACTSSLPC
jgi:integrase